MSDYIEREALIESFKVNGGEITYGETMLGAIISRINSAPAADVVEVKHGYWEFRYERKYNFHCRTYCSVCGKHSGIGGIITNQAKPYCPNCGAKMDSKAGAEE